MIITHRGIVLLDSVYKTQPSTRHQMARVLEIYEMLGDFLFQSEEEQVDQMAADMINAVRNVPLRELGNAGKEAWNQHAELYIRTLTELQHVALEEKEVMIDFPQEYETYRNNVPAFVPRFS